MRMSYQIEIHPQFIMEQLGRYRSEDGKPLLVLSIQSFLGIERFLSEGLPMYEASEYSRPCQWEKDVYGRKIP